MSIQDKIQSKLVKSFNPKHLEVINESGMHNVPPGSESHFKLVVVSATFAGQSLLARHRSIYDLLKVEMEQSIHALSMQLFTPEEWVEKGGEVIDSPKCRGGG